MTRDVWKLGPVTVEIDDGGYEPMTYRVSAQHLRPANVTAVTIHEWIDCEAGAAWVERGHGEYLGDGRIDFTAKPFSEGVPARRLGMIEEALRKSPIAKGWP